MFRYNRKENNKWYGSGRNFWGGTAKQVYRGDIKAQKIIKHPSLIIYEYLKKEGKLTKKYPEASTEKVKRWKQ